ncbi:MAG: hemerythrin domain-containing protein [Mariprofundaceae bacterium]|nr:hemerythrin domain-containing protein [Mariprofundaceae bacterium]
MPHLIEELKGHHAALKRMLDLLQNSSDKEEQLELLKAAKERLFSHIGVEDAQLYPFLREEAEKDPKLAKLLTMFDEDMTRVTELVVSFFAKYDSGWRNKNIFLMDVAELEARLAHRIETEENSLYPEYFNRKMNATEVTKGSVLTRLKGLFK